MRKFCYSVLLVCSLFLYGCEVEFDFKDLDDEPLFLMDGNLRVDSFSPGTGNFQMYLYAVPSAAGDREFSEEARCTLKVYRNSELIDIKDQITIESFYGLIADNYMMESGDEIVITAESDGFPMASARTVVPQSPPIPDVSCSMSGENLNVVFSFEDDGATDDAYAFRFMTTASDGQPWNNETGFSIDLPFGDTSESFLSDMGPFDIIWQDGVRYYGILDDSFNGRRKELDLIFPVISIDGGIPTYFRIEVHRISRERLRYEIACHDKGSNMLGFIGLAPVTFAYTNVSGGSGCLSSANVSYTDWIRIEGGE